MGKRLRRLQRNLENRRRVRQGKLPKSRHNLHWISSAEVASVIQDRSIHERIERVDDRMDRFEDRMDHAAERISAVEAGLADLWLTQDPEGQDATFEFPGADVNYLLPELDALDE